MEIEPVVRISLNGNSSSNNQNNRNNNNINTSNSNIKKPNSRMISNIHKSPSSLSSSVDETLNNNNNNGNDEDIIKLARDLTNTFGILLGDQDQPSQFSDVIFKVGDRKFFASKIMLVARSEYFKAMFTGSMKESSIKEITLEGVDPDVFFAVLRYICVGILDLDYDHRMVSSIYQYCDLLGLARAKELSLATMSKIAQMYLDKPDVENALLLWDSLNASSIPVESVHPNLRAFVLQYASISLHCDAFYSISLTTLIQMLRNDGLRMEELDILDCVIDWCRENSSGGGGGNNNNGGGGGNKHNSKRNSLNYTKKHEGDGGSDGSCSSRCSSRRNSLSLKNGENNHFKSTHSFRDYNGSNNNGNGGNNDCDTEETYSDIDNGSVGGDQDDFESDDDDDDDEEDEEEDFTDDDDKDDSANDDYEYSTNKDGLDIIEDWDNTIDKNLLDEILPLIRWENMNIGEAFERLDNLKIIPDKEISNLLRHILKSNRGESFSFLGYHYRRPRNNRKRPYPIEFLLGITQPFDSPNVSNEIIPLNSFSSEFGQSTNQFLYKIKKDIKLPANLERFSFKDREFFVQLKEREKGQLAVYLAFGNKLTKPLAISVLASVIGFRFQESIEFSFKKMFDEGFDSAWGWPKFISLDTLLKQDKYTHFSDSFCLLIELTISQWG